MSNLDGKTSCRKLFDMLESRLSLWIQRRVLVKMLCARLQGLYIGRTHFLTAIDGTGVGVVPSLPREQVPELFFGASLSGSRLFKGSANKLAVPHGRR